MEHYDDPENHRRTSGGRGECETTLQYGIHTNVDEMYDAANRAYAGWPTRLYMVVLDGKVVYAGGLGSYDFKPEKLRA